MTDQAELRACPWGCKGGRHWTKDHGQYFVRCNVCFACGPRMPIRDEAIACWNMRPDEAFTDMLRTNVHLLEKDLAEAKRERGEIGKWLRAAAKWIAPEPSHD